MQYTVYFEIYGKKMKTHVEAYSEVEAEEMVRERLNIIKCVSENTVNEDDHIQNIRDVFNRVGIKI